MEEKEVLDFLVIGAGPVGLYAGMKLQKKNMNFLIVEKNKKIGGQPSFLYPSKIVSNIPGEKEISAHGIFKIFKPATFKKKILTNTHVSKMEHEDKIVKIKLSSGRVVYAKNVLICSGLGSHTTNEIGIPGDKKRVIYTVTSTHLFRDKIVVILGGGYSAVDWAVQISKIAKSVSLVYRGVKLKVPKQEEEKLSSSSSKVFMNWTAQEIVDNDGIIIKNNEIKSEETLPFDYIIVQYGCVIQKVSYSFNKELKLNWNKVVVDKKQKSNLANIYACGDCCTYEGKFNTIKAGMEEVDKVI